MQWFRFASQFGCAALCVFVVSSSVGCAEGTEIATGGAGGAGGDSTSSSPTTSTSSSMTTTSGMTTTNTTSSHSSSSGGTGCGDGTCQASETCASCPSDCQAQCPTCGDGMCTAPESCGSCPADCTTNCAVCGNGTCENGETVGTCPADCDMGGGTCHDPCQTGGAMDILDCGDLCVIAVCTTSGFEYCCLSAWDQACVSEAENVLFCLCF